MINNKNKRNPILPLDVHIPDSEAHVMPDGRLYIYGSFDNRDDAYCSDVYRVVSTPDMEHWTVHDTALRGRDIPWVNNPDSPRYSGLDWNNPTPFLKKVIENNKASDKKKTKKRDEPVALLYAPDAIHKNGKYYLYFCMSDDSEGVAISDKPEGPFTNPVQLPCGGIDPAIFIDDDGQAYYYWGQLFSHGVKLNEDMISFDPNNIVHDLLTEEKHYFHEGTSLRKIGDTYYCVYSNMERGKPTSLGYATSKSPLGPFEYQGIIIDNEGCDPSSWNNHGSIQQFNNKWYVFYHRCSRGVERYRRLCVEPITINEDGTIDEVKMTSQGVGAPFESGEKIMAYQACELKGDVYIDVDDEYGEKLRNINSEDEAIFRYVNNHYDYNKIIISAAGNGKVEVLFDGCSAGVIEIQDGEQINEGIKMKPGKYELRLKFQYSDHLELYEVAFG